MARRRRTAAARAYPVARRALAIGAFALLATLATALLGRGVVVAVAAALAAGFALTGWLASARLAEAPPDDIEGRGIVVTGVVASLPQQGPSGLRFRFALDGDSAPAGVPRLLALGWYEGFHEDAALAQPRQAPRDAPAGRVERCALGRARASAIVTRPACGAWQWLADASVDGSCERAGARRWHRQLGAAPR